MSDRPSRWDTPAAPGSGSAADGAAGSSSNAGTLIAAPISASDAATAAAAIAAKIAASLQPQDGALVKRVSEEGDYIRDIEINDLKNRYVLTKGATQKQIEEETGASVTTKGTWIHDRSKMLPDETPLYIHIVAKTATALQAAAEKVQDLIDKELGPLLDARTMAARNRALGLPPPEGWLPGGRVKWPEAKLEIGLESLRNFNVRAKTVGPGGIFVKHIQAETGARVQIKGRGSGFMETDTGRESDEPMHINIAAPTEDQIGRAKALAEDLLVVLRIEYQKARDGTAMGGAPGVYQPGSGTYAPAQNGPDYASYYKLPAGIFRERFSSICPMYCKPVLQASKRPQRQYGARKLTQQQQAQQQQQGTPGQMGGTPAGAGQAQGVQNGQSPVAAASGAQGQAQAGATPGQGAIPQEGTEAWNQFAAYWAAYGYDVKDERFTTWYQQTYGGQQAQA